MKTYWLSYFPLDPEASLEEFFWLKSDPKNIWLFVHLAKVYLAENKFDEFDAVLKRGFEIHPYYEPLYLLKAQKLFDEKKYGESFETLEQLIKINPRYKSAAQLLEAVKKKAPPSLPIGKEFKN